MSLKELVRSHVPSGLAQRVRRLGAHWRYARRIRRCREGYREFGNRYAHPLIFIAGLPKSGTSWVESMLASYPGYQHLVIPEAVRYELQHGGSHNFDLPSDTVDRFERSLAVLKLHVHGSAHNTRLLHESEVPYVVLYRDLRDVAVSHYFYVRRTPWHPEYEVYRGLDLEDGLRHFTQSLLPDFVDWVYSWRKRRHPELSMELRYEDLLEDTKRQFQTVASHFDLDTSPSTVRRIVAENTFESMSNGRSRGEADTESFVRKGVSGDWKNHFTSPLKELFKEKAGQALIDFGYEEDLDW